MHKKNYWRWVVALLALLALTAASCGNDDSSEDSADPGDTPETTASDDGGDDGGDEGDEGDEDGSGDEPCPGTEGCIPEGQPDVNDDGVVKIGVLSPGDTNDNGYYESFVVTAREYADNNDWELIIVDQVNPSDAQSQARNICRQGVDMVAIAASELADAIPVAEEDVCAGTVWYVAGGDGVEQSPYFFQTTDDVYETQFATGVAAGHVLEATGGDTAGYVTGPELDFAITTLDAFTAGLKRVNEDFEALATYTGDFDDSGVAREGAQAQLDQGVDILYPYLGGATDAVADLGAENGVLSITPGTDRCADERFAISSIFSPGAFFAAALQLFEEGNVQLGVTQEFRLGVDAAPDVMVCEDNVEGGADIQAEVDELIEQIAAGEVDPTAEVEGAAG